MIFAIARVLMVALVVLTIVRLIVAVYARSVERERLEKEWDAGGITGTREAFVHAGIEAYRKSLRRKLLWLVYILPMALVVTIAYVVNSQ